MKLIMHEDAKKYAVRGISKYPLGRDFIGGEKTFDENFQKGLRLFKDYADQIWNNAETERLENSLLEK